MALNDTLTAIQWWNSGTSPWTQSADTAKAVTDFTGAEQGEITGYITSLYASGTAADTLERARGALTTIRIGKSVDPLEPAFVAQGATGQFYLGFNKTEVAKIWYFNVDGTLVAENPMLTLIHEFGHVIGKKDPEGPGGVPPNETLENGAAWDFEGSALRLQNKVARELSLTNNVQASYDAALGGSDGRRDQFTLGANYTENETIKIARIGDDNANNLDMTARRDDSRDLMFGLGGDDILKGGGGRDFLYGGGDKDKLWGGDGNDLLVGEDADDEFRGEKGDDTIWGGLKDFDIGLADGNDLVDYSAVVIAAGTEAGIAVDFNAATNRMIVGDAEGGTDTLVSIEKVIATARHDTFTFSGNGTNAKIDLTDLQDGFAKAEEGGQVVRVKGFDEFIGGAGLTVFIGNGETGREVVFRAGSGGGDFTLRAGNRAWGHDDAVDIFRVTTTVPTEFAGYTDAQKIEYLRENRVFIGNFGENDQLYVDGVLFNGNKVSSQIAPALPVQPNNDSHTTTIWLTGNSSYNTLYAQAQHEVRGPNDSSYVFGSNHVVRDASYQLVDDGDPDTIFGLISFDSRTGHGGLNPEEFELNALAATDGMLRILIEDFADGDGGIGFTHDSLSSLPFVNGLVGNILVDTPSVTSPMRLAVELQYDVIDGTQDGWVYGGGAAVDSDSEHFNFGRGVELGAGGADGYVLGSEELTGTEGNDILAGGQGADLMSGLGGADQLAGGAGDDELHGGAGDDQLAGGDGDDWLLGGTGLDSMAGGAGDDVYGVDSLDDAVVETAGAGTDTVRTSLASYALADHVENLAYTAAGSFTGTGNALANLLAGGAGDDSLSGGDGDDSFESSGGTDLLDGGAGTDTLRVLGDESWISIAEDGGVYTIADLNFGPGGNVLTSVERIYFSALDESFTIAELLDRNVTGTNDDDQPLVGNDLGNELYGLDGDDLLIGAGGYDVLDGGQGADTAWFAGSSDEYRLFLDTDGSAVVEALAGNEATDYLYDVEAIYFADDDVTILVSTLPALGTAGNDALTGSARADQLFAFGGDDSLAGLDGDDILLGDEGNDTLDGGAGADLLYGGLGDDSYFVDEAGDYVVEFEDEGYDIVYAAVSYALSQWEHVELLGTVDNNAVTALNLTGNGFDNYVTGNAGANLIDGGDGADQLWGRAGDDSYYVEAGDAVVEYAGDGNDIVYARSSFWLGVDMAVETLGTIDNTATTAMSLGGNALDNYITGNAGANLLYGGGGSDILWGREGDDSYFADMNDVIVEYDGQGSDILYASGSYVLNGGLSIEVLGTVDNNATTAIDLKGNELANYVTGNAGANAIDGGAGSDYLQGRGGADSFAFTTALGATNVDMIADFASGSDKIALDDAIFAGVGTPGGFIAAAFVAGTAAQDANDRIVYDQATGQLYYDADGSGAGAASLFAIVAGAPTLTAADFMVI